MFTAVFPAVLRFIVGFRSIILKVCYQYHYCGYGGLLFIQVSYSSYYRSLLGWRCRFDSCSPQLHCFISDGLLQHWRFSELNNSSGFYCSPFCNSGYSAVLFFVHEVALLEKSRCQNESLPVLVPAICQNCVAG